MLMMRTPSMALLQESCREVMTVVEGSLLHLQRQNEIFDCEAILVVAPRLIAPTLHPQTHTSVQEKES